jgi:hypothetical protein
MWGEEGEFLQTFTCTEGMVVYAAGISVKVDAYYTGRSVSLPQELLSPGGAGRSQQRA